MEMGCIVQHVAVECVSEHLADLFFSEILGLPKVRSTMLSKELSTAIFRINTEVRFVLYDNGSTRFEVFIADRSREPTFAHVCLVVNKKENFVSRCMEQGLAPFIVERNGKQLLFVRDFTGNLFEVLENNKNINDEQKGNIN